MKTVTVTPDQLELTRLIEEVYAGHPLLLAYGEKVVVLHRHVPEPDGALDLEEDSPELEKELLKGISGPFSSYSREDLQAIVDRARRKNSGA